jgi:hypothetical protein
MQDTSQLEENYECAHIELNNLYNRFHDIPGYVREKSGEELALQAAKKVFGRFNPDDKEAMELNTNNGQGFTVQLDDGTTLHLNNQLELYNKVVAFNKAHGGFCDENYIKHTNIADYRLLTDLQFKVEIAKEALIGAFPNKKAGFAKAREIETRTRKSLAPGADSNTRPNNHTPVTPNGQPQLNSNNSAMSLPRMRVPLFSSIPSTFRQAKTLFTKSDANRVNTALSNFKGRAATDKELIEQLNKNLNIAADVNEALGEPVNASTETRIKELAHKLSTGNEQLETFMSNGAQADDEVMKQYDLKMKDELNTMKKLTSNHPIQSIRSLLNNIIKKTLETIKNFTTSAVSMLGKSAPELS